MFYELTLRSHVRVPPNLFKEDPKSAVLARLKESFEGFISNDIGAVIAISSVEDVGDGIIIAGDGAAYYDTLFKVFSFKPELQEVVLGTINEITDFGAFIDIGPLDGMIHISQTMDDYVSFSKSGVLTGKEFKKVLKPNDLCRARIIAVSYKEVTNPKIGLTMRQPRLGAVVWVKEEISKKEPKKEKKNG